MGHPCFSAALQLRCILAQALLSCKNAAQGQMEFAWRLEDSLLAMGFRQPTGSERSPGGPDRIEWSSAFCRSAPAHIDMFPLANRQ
jgi:hypothetical protein